MYSNHSSSYLVQSILVNQQSLDLLSGSNLTENIDYSSQQSSIYDIVHLSYTDLSKDEVVIIK